MIGRGTRLCPDLLGVDMDKERFLIFDFVIILNFLNLILKDLREIKQKHLLKNYLI